MCRSIKLGSGFNEEEAECEKSDEECLSEAESYQEEIVVSNEQGSALILFNVYDKTVCVCVCVLQVYSCSNEMC